MNLFRLDAQERLHAIHEQPFKLEKEIQTLTERNMSTLFGLHLVRSEFTIGRFRIDSLAFDEQSRAFVIIEYKRNSSFSVIDQGYAYLALMLNNKADFILEYNEANPKRALRKNDVDWSQSRVLFVAPTFTAYQRESINFKDLPIELWEIHRYDNQTIAYHAIQAASPTESINTISSQDTVIAEVTKEVKVYTEDDHLDGKSEAVQELYQTLKQKILEIGEITIKPTKLYIGFVGRHNIVDIHIQQQALKIWINLSFGELKDPAELMRDVSQTGHWGNGDYEVRLNNDDNADYLIGLIKQSYKQNG